MFVSLLALIPLIHAQVILYDTSHNTTSLRGTWSTTTDYVLTSSMIANPVNSTFNVPEQYKSASSASYSFTDDGFWEQYIYRLVAHGTSSCTQGLTIYQHGTYTHGPDGSLLLVPFWQDGRIQILDQCGSDPISLINQTEHIRSWRIMDGPVLRLEGEYYTPVGNMTRVYDTPQMLPTKVLSSWR
ncbi:chaperone for protein folding within the ER, fungal protein [Rhizoctonia solani AG-3 Rhs1AP]|nr:chaperone for protein folding within the ER, fungal protein [Rhizoctonia solani AG-3 Rhs1AP]